jgi:hypothetical protein
MPHRKLANHEHEHEHEHDGHIKIHVHLSKAQVSKARNGHPIQLGHHQIGHGPYIIHAHPETHAKLVKAHRSEKGVRIHLTHHEMLHGAGFLDVLKGIAPTVLNGLAGAAKEIFPGHDKLINGIRGAVKGATGFGLRPKKQMHHGHAMHSEHSGFMHGDGLRGPNHFPTHKSDHYGFGLAGAIKKKAHKKAHKKSHLGHGIMPSGFGY